MTPEAGGRVKIILPIPNRILSPNYKVASLRGRMMVASSVKRHRRLAREAIESQSMDGADWQHCIVEVTFFHSVNRRRDEDNMIGTLKSYYDGIVDSGLAVDDDRKHMRRCIPCLLIDKESPRVEFLITESTEGEMMTC